MASVALHELRKVYPGGVVAIERLDLSVADGEFVVLLGPSGCGKTTVLQMIAGLEPATSGQILFDSQDVTMLSAEKRDVAMVFQSYALYPNMRVYDNMAFGLKMRHTPKPEIDTRVREAARSLDLTHVLGRKPSQLSGGQRQRVALGRAIVRQPRLFLLDEPLSNVDAKLRGEMRRELKSLHRQLGTTFIYVTHDQVEAMSMGDRVAVFSDGRLEQFDTPMSIYQRPASLFVAGFVGTPSMNLVRGRLEEAGTFASGDFRYMWEHHRWSPEMHRSDVVFGFRPTDVKVSLPSSSPHHFRMRVLFSEPLGSDLLLSVACGDQQLVIRADPDFDVADGEEVDLFVPEARVHLFDAQSGVRFAAAAEGVAV